MKNLKLNELAQIELSKKEMQNINGGEKICHCACAGPSSTDANGWANADKGLSSPGGGDIFIIADPVIIIAPALDS